jgi:glycosyltransferase involved in cell wall biosynthesis
VVPTHDRPEALRRCLDALARQTALDELEVIVVDDGSVVVSAVEAVVSAYSFARLVQMRHSGPASARNRGAACALGRYVCFTDDDCEPSPTWVSGLAGALNAGGDAVAGRTVTGEPGSSLGAAYDLVAGAPALVDATSGGQVSFAPSNNLGARLALLCEVRFDESYPVAAGEDRDWCRRVVAKGYVILSEPDAVIVHRPQPTVRAFLRQQVRYGRGAFLFRRRGPEPQSLEPPGFYLALVRRGFGHGPAAGTLVAAAQVATAVGYGLAWLADRKR